MSPRRILTALGATLTLLAAAPAAAPAQSPVPTDPATTAPAAPVPTPPAAGYTADTPKQGALYHDGPAGRYLLGGAWLFRLDPKEVGLTDGYQTDTSTTGWTQTTVPNAWNATDQSAASFKGTVGWYRKDFRLPSAKAALSWIVRFESVNYRSKVWLNGRPLGTNRGAYLPFEFRLPASLLKRDGVNRLVVRVDNRRGPSDFPPSNLNPKGNPTGGWWNYGGLLREVYLRKVDRIDFNSVLVRPTLPTCIACAANVLFRVVARNVSDAPQTTALNARFGDQHVSLGTKVLAPGQVAAFTVNLTVAKPRLWSPAAPNLYDVGIYAKAGKTLAQRYVLRSGIRKIEVSPEGGLLLNGQKLDLRGFGLHEDSPDKGFAIDNATRDQELAEVREAGGTLIRSHYPLHPYTQEQADRLGLLLWSEIPVYAIKTKELKSKLVRDLAAKDLRDNIVANGNHPSVLLWSIGNELSATPGRVQGLYIARAVHTAHELDPTRPVGLAINGYPSAGCQAEYAPLDVIGMNVYFGWYPGPSGQIADRTLTSAYMDSVHDCYPKKALMVSEFGVEANRNGPVEEKGTFQFQDDWIDYMLGVFDSKPWLNGAIYWAIREFRVRPDWDGGNPRPDPPIHEKGLITFAGVRKPAFYEVQKAYRATKQFG